MIHYTCDRCHRPIDVTQEIRYTVRIEVTAAADDQSGWMDEDRDHLAQIEEIIQSLESVDSREGRMEPFQRQVFDLCSSCHDRFVRDPIGNEHQAEVGFSEN